MDIVEEDKCPSCGTRNAHHSDKTKKEILNRLNRIEGQIRGISKMINEDIYCDDILNQITSVESALNGVKKELLEAHIKTCVVDQIREGQDDVIDELMKTIKRMLK
ncbi:MAG: CsoR family transcriptional regulator [Spirochaetes bacterium GWC1_27_15]|nr:MAG: CsoR family transcriptional regulator [Spirochaetes bacterium GWB1_27_13]OHD27061.1 MAG: CsoR family transcriptional regulator [Spirochaetes bacterium GWC1_27_15]